MTSSYEEIFSSYYLKQKDPRFFELDEEVATEMMIGWLHSIVTESHVRSAFESITFDDDMMELDFTLKKPINDDSDMDFVIEVFAQGMVICWMRPLVDNAVNLAVMIGGKEQKKLQSNYATNISRLDSLERKLKKYIRDYGYFNGEYV